MIGVVLLLSSSLTVKARRFPMSRGHRFSWGPHRCACFPHPCGISGPLLINLFAHNSDGRS